MEEQQQLPPYLIGAILSTKASVISSGISLVYDTDQERTIWFVEVLLNQNENIIKDRVYSLGLDTDKRDITIPEECFGLSVGDKLELLQGLMDSDGYVEDGKVLLQAESKELLNGVIDICKTIGGKAKFIEPHTIHIEFDELDEVCPFLAEDGKLLK